MAFDNTNQTVSLIMDTPIPKTYIRLIVTLNPNGIDMLIEAYFYGNKTRFKASITNLIKVPFTTKWNVKYNRFEDGYDELGFAHIKGKELLLIANPEWDADKLKIIDIFPVK